MTLVERHFVLTGFLCLVAIEDGFEGREGREDRRRWRIDFKWMGEEEEREREGRGEEKRV